MVSLVVYGNSEKEAIDKIIEELKESRLSRIVGINKETYEKEMDFSQYRFKIYSTERNIGLNGWFILDNETENTYYLLNETEALKYCGSNSLYLNEIYCAKSVNKKEIFKLYAPCVRNKDLLFPIGLDYWDFEEIYWDR